MPSKDRPILGAYLDLTVRSQDLSGSMLHGIPIPRNGITRLLPIEAHGERSGWVSKTTGLLEKLHLVDFVGVLSVSL